MTKTPDPAQSNSLPLWQSHKQDRAAQIVAASELHATNGARFYFAPAVVGDPAPAPIDVDTAWVRKHAPPMNPRNHMGFPYVESFVGGYYVEHPHDGYTSWSPAKAFEEGYRLIAVDMAKPATDASHGNEQIISHPDGTKTIFRLPTHGVDKEMRQASTDWDTPLAKPPVSDPGAALPTDPIPGALANLTAAMVNQTDILRTMADTLALAMGRDLILPALEETVGDRSGRSVLTDADVQAEIERTSGITNAMRGTDKHEPYCDVCAGARSLCPWKGGDAVYPIGCMN